MNSLVLEKTERENITTEFHMKDSKGPGAQRYDAFYAV